MQAPSFPSAHFRFPFLELQSDIALQHILTKHTDRVIGSTSRAFCIPLPSRPPCAVQAPLQQALANRFFTKARCPLSGSVRESRDGLGSFCRVLSSYS